MLPPFPERVHFIIRHATSLRKFDYIVIDDDESSDYSVQILRTCLTALEWSGSKPRLSISTRRLILGEPLEDILLYINDRYSVTRLDVESEGIRNDLVLQFLARFRQLQHLCVWDFKSNDSSTHDMDRFLRHLSIETLTIYYMNQVASFPHQVRILDIHDNSILTNSVWTATCNLKHLSELSIECRDLEERQDEQSFIFKSSDLRSLSGSLSTKTEAILRHQIIQPIFSSCQHLTTIELYISSSLSSVLLALLLSKDTLVDVDVSSPASPYTFQEFADLPKTLPNLRSLQLPWPASIGILTNDDDGTVMDWRYERDHSDDIPERLTFDQCQRLSAKYPNLDEIVFQIDSEEETHNAHWTWMHSRSHFFDMPLDPAKVDVDKSRRIQTFKMTRFIDEESPCLNICSIFCHFDDPSYTDIHELEKSIVIFLALNQVRRHVGMS
jgi:hypothetical protein